MAKLGVLKQTKRCRTPNFAGSTKKQHKAVSLFVDDVCRRCNDINWLDLAQNAPDMGGSCVTVLAEPHDELRQSPCRICRLLALIKPTRLDNSACTLRASKTFLREIFPGHTTNIQDTTVVGVDASDKPYKLGPENGLLAVLDPGAELSDFGPRNIQPDRVDFALVKEWMALCQKEHALSCSTDSTNGVPCLNVIDCERMAVVTAPVDCRYTALSYVWGDTGLGPNANLGRRPKRFCNVALPRVVEDSISVTISLGYRYLWVDRYCIDQNDERKHDQLRHMGEIYSCAQLTFIAAAGEDSSYGLPGVSTRHRQQQQHTTMNGVKLLQVFPHALHTLKVSKWASRAWTYQECFLATRRLIFTDQQVSYLCNSCYCPEIIRRPGSVFDAETRALFDSFIPIASHLTLGSMETTSALKLWDIGAYSIKKQPELMREQIMEYTTRQLSYESDILSAFLGILHHFETYSLPLYHLWGVPVMLPLIGSVMINLAWYHDQPGARRDHFPSWTWVGWKGPVHISRRAVRIPSDCQIQVVDNNGDLVPLHEFTQSSISTIGRLVNYSPYLHLTALAFELPFAYIEWTENQKSSTESVTFFWKGGSNVTHRESYRDGYYCWLEISEDLNALAYVYLDQPASLEDSTLCLLVSQDNWYIGDFMSAQEQTMIVVKPRDGYYERIGLIRMRHGAVIPEMTPTPPIMYTDGAGNFVDVVHIGSGRPLWLHQGARITVKLR